MATSQAAMKRQTAAQRQMATEITHPDVVLFPATGTTKLDVARYYETVADWMLPHLRNRPLTLKQCAPDVEHCRYLRHSRERDVPNVRFIEIQEQRKRGRYMIVDSVDALLALVQRRIFVRSIPGRPAWHSHAALRRRWRRTIHSVSPSAPPIAPSAAE